MSSAYPLTSPIEIKGSGGSPGQIDFSDGTNSVEVKAPTGLTGNINFTLPPNTGTTNQVLRTSGSGVTSWQTILGISNSSLPLSVKLTNRNGAPSQTASTVFAVRGNVIYDGTTTDKPITKIQAIVETTNNAASVQVRIFDFTNSNVIATSAIVGPTVGSVQRTILDLGIISNLPTGQANFEIQLRNPAGSGAAQLHVCQFYA